MYRVSIAVTRSDAGGDTRDNAAGNLEACKKHDISFGKYLDDHFGVIGALQIPRLADPTLPRTKYSR